jgi:hypothetical protein
MKGDIFYFIFYANDETLCYNFGIEKFFVFRINYHHGDFNANFFFVGQKKDFLRINLLYVKYSRRSLQTLV